jgi:hypothetical protein
MTRGAVTLTPTLILPARLVRTGRTVVHPILGTDDADLTIRPAGPRTGELRTLWLTAADAAAAVEALGVAGGAWTIADSGDADMTCQVVGDIVQDAPVDGWAGRTVTITVQEVSA